MKETTEDILKLVRPPTLVRQLAADTLRKAIITGALSPGERLVESSLSKRMGVSRPSIREALSQLAAEKIITMTPNRGPAVATIKWAEAESIYEVRALLEAEAAARAAKLASSDDIARMRKFLRDFELALPAYDVSLLVASTAEFYAVMLGACGNSIITEIIDGLTARISFLRAKSMSLHGRANHSLLELKAILDAIEARDAKGAHRACALHVQTAMTAARAVFDEITPPIDARARE